MADDNNTQTGNDSKADKKETTLDGMTSYRTFDSTDDAAAYLAECQTKFSDFANQPFAMVGVSDEGFDPAIYGEDMNVRVAVVRNVPRTVGGKREPTTIKAIVVGPVPKLDSLLATEAGRQYVEKIMNKENNHVLVRPVRDAESLDTAVAQMPTTAEAFMSSGRESAGIMEAFNDLYKTVNDALAAKVPAWARARLNKQELKRALESTAYATEYYPTLEDRGEGKESFFVTALKLAQQLAKSQGKDTSIFDKWLATRDQQTLTVTPTDEDDGDLDIDALVAAVESKETPATDAAKTEDSTDEPTGDDTGTDDSNESDTATA